MDCISPALDATPLMLVLGNACVDVTVEVSAQDLESLGMKPGEDASGETQEFKERIVHWALRQQRLTSCAGGAALNSARVAKWTGGSALRVAFLGAVGRDQHAEILRSAMHAVGVSPLLLETEEHTGVAVSLVETISRDRTLAMLRGASIHLSPAFATTEAVAKCVAEAGLVYITSFVLSTPPRAALAKDLASLAGAHGAPLALNLSSAGILKKVYTQLCELLPHCRYIFGNVDEVVTFAELQGWQTPSTADVDELLIAGSMLAGLLAPNGCAVVTAGAAPTMVCPKDGKAYTVPVPHVHKAEIKDTNGCGDSFVGGFLSKALTGHDLKTCVSEGHICASIILQRHGCDLSIARDQSLDRT